MTISRIDSNENPSIKFNVHIMFYYREECSLKLDDLFIEIAHISPKSLYPVFPHHPKRVAFFTSSLVGLNEMLPMYPIPV